MCTHGLVAMTSAPHAEGRQFVPGWVYGSAGGSSQRLRFVAKHSRLARMSLRTRNPETHALSVPRNLALCHAWRLRLLLV